MSQGVNKHGVEYTKLSEKSYLCRLYLGEGITLEKIFNITFEALKKINLNDMMNQKKK